MMQDDGGIVYNVDCRLYVYYYVYIDGSSKYEV